MYLWGPHKIQNCEPLKRKYLFLKNPTDYQAKNMLNSDSLLSKKYAEKASCLAHITYSGHR